MQKRDSKFGYLILVCFAFLLSSILVSDVNAQSETAILLTDLQVEYFTNPIEIDDYNPRLSCKIQSTERNIRQTAYQIQVFDTPELDV